MSSNVFHKDGVGSTGVDGGVARVRTSSPHRSKQGKGSPKMGQQAFKTTSIYTHRRVPSTPRLLKSKLHLDVCVCARQQISSPLQRDSVHITWPEKSVSLPTINAFYPHPPLFDKCQFLATFSCPTHFNLNTNITQPMKCFLFLPNVQRGPWSMSNVRHWQFPHERFIYSDKMWRRPRAAQLRTTRSRGHQHGNNNSNNRRADGQNITRC